MTEQHPCREQGSVIIVDQLPGPHHLHYTQNLHGLYRCNVAQASCLLISIQKNITEIIKSVYDSHLRTRSKINVKFVRRDLAANRGAKRTKSKWF